MGSYNLGPSFVDLGLLESTKVIDRKFRLFSFFAILTLLTIFEHYEIQSGKMRLAILPLGLYSTKSESSEKIDFWRRKSFFG